MGVLPSFLETIGAPLDLIHLSKDHPRLNRRRGS